MDATTDATAGLRTAAPEAPAVTPSSSTVGAGLAFALASAAAFGLSGSLARSLLDLGWSPAAVVSARMGGAFLALVVPCLLLVRRVGLPDRRSAGRLLAYGVVAVAGAQLCFFSAVQYLSVGVALLLEYLAPVILIGWHWAVQRQRPRATVLAGAALAIGGLLLVLDVRHGLSLNPVGVAWGLAAALCLCAYFLLSAQPSGSRPVPALVLTTVGTGVGSLVVLLVGLTGVLPLTAVAGTTSLGGLVVGWWVPLALLALVAGAFSYLTGIMAVRRLGSSIASFVALAEVIFAVVFAALLLGQQPTAGQLVGGALILAGIAAVQSGPYVRRPGSGRPAGFGRRRAGASRPKIHG